MEARRGKTLKEMFFCQRAEEAVYMLRPTVNVSGWRTTPSRGHLVESLRTEGGAPTARLCPGY